MINNTKLFDELRSMAPDKRLSQVQVDSVTAILENCVKYKVTDNRQIAYILATAWHESRLRPVEEIGRGSGKPFGKLVNGHAYYGRGLVQITWYDNYKMLAKLLHVDLIGRPELALQTDIAAQIAVIGMVKGLFTGVGLSRYFNDKLTDPINARKIINGLDAAVLIKGYYEHILTAL